MDNNNDREELYKRAFDYINQHRPELTREINKSNPVVSPGAHNSQDSHRGVVKHPENDMRLKENKEKQQDDSSREEEHNDNDSILESKDKANRERKLLELQKLHDRATTAAFTLKPQTKEHVPTHSFTPKSQQPEHVPTHSFVPNPNKETNPHIPQNLGNAVDKVKPVPGQSKQESELRQHPKIGPYVDKALGPNPTTPEKLSKVYDKIQKASRELKNNPHYGVMVSSIFGDTEITAQKLNLVRERLHKALAESEEMNVRNSIHAGISLTASMILELGFMKDAE